MPRHCPNLLDTLQTNEAPFPWLLNYFPYHEKQVYNVSEYCCESDGLVLHII